MRKCQWDIYVPLCILGQEKCESPKCLIEKILSFFLLLNVCYMFYLAENC